MRVLLALLLSTMAAVEAGAQNREPKVIWLTIDTLRAENLHFMGYERETSPWMDKLAGKSVVFKWALSPSHATVVSVPSYMTGKYQSELFYNSFRDTWLPSKFTMLAESFKEAGFRTHWYTTNGNAARAKNHDQGIDEYHQLFPQGQVSANIEEVINFVKSKYSPGVQKEFIYVHLNDVHDPYRPPFPFDTMFGPMYRQATVHEGYALNKDRIRLFSNIPYFSEKHNLNQHDIDFLIGQYDGGIRYVDSKLNELLEAFDFDFKRDMLILSADHGEQFFEHGFLAHGRSMRSQDFRVPLIIYGPNFKPGQYDHAVSLLDLYPTLAELFGLEKPAGLRGTSLVPVLKGQAYEPHKVVAESADWRGRSALVVYGKYWYAINTQANILRPWLDWPYMEMLFDIQADPKCMVNIAAKEFDVANRYNEMLRNLDERFSSFAPNVIRKQGKLQFGPNLFSTDPKNDLSFSRFQNMPGLTKTKGGGVKLDVPAAKIVLTAETDPGFRYHLFEVDFSLESGWLTFEMQRADNAETLWKHEFRKPKSTGAKFRHAFYPKSEKTQLLIYMEKPGKATINPPTLRESNMKIVWPKRLPIHMEKPEKEDKGEVTEADKARLEALGYL